MNALLASRSLGDTRTAARIEEFVLGKNTHVVDSVTPSEREQDALDEIVEYYKDKHRGEDYTNLRLRIVGGWVRDKVLDFMPHDIDVVVDAPGKKTSGHRYMSFSMQYYDGLLSVNVGGHDVQFMESLGTPLEDCLRRDFTINALSYDVTTKRVTDLVDGLADLREGVIRSILSPEMCLQADPVRALRAIRFAARYRFRIAEDLAKAIRAPSTRRALQDPIHCDVVAKELEKMRDCTSPVQAQRLMKAFGFKSLQL